MAQITLKNRSGADAGKVDLDDLFFGIEPNVAVMHQVVTAQLAARRAGTQSTLTRAEVAGGGAKPWKQKGTGRARQGSIRSPQWKGGGIALGPKPRSYAQRTPKKMIRLALRSALSDRAAEGKVVVVDQWGFDAPHTKDAVAALSALGIEGRVLLVLDASDAATWKSFRNLPHVHIIDKGQLNAYDVLVSDYVVFSTDTLPSPTADDRAPREKAARPAARPRAARPDAEDPVKPVKPVKPKAKPVAAVATLPRVTKTVAVPDTLDDSEHDPSELSGGEADMSTDLPNRPKSDTKKRSEIKATDRVKSAADKPDPRFEAARKKVNKEDELRAKVAKGAADADAAPEEDAADDASDAPADDKPKKGFSFNMTDQEGS